MDTYPYIVTEDRIFYVDANGDWWEWHAESGSGLGALGGFWSFLGQIGSMVSYAIPGIGPVVGPIATAATGALSQSAAKGKQEKEIGAQWETLAGETVALFNRIQAQAVITAADAQQAAAKLTQLGQAAQQYGSISYIANQWNSAAYKPAFEQRLQQIIAAAQTQPTVSQTPGVGNQVAGAVSVEGLFSNPVVVGGAVLLGAVLLLR